MNNYMIIWKYAFRTMKNLNLNIIYLKLQILINKSIKNIHNINNKRINNKKYIMINKFNI